jgi:hypothetical protein
MASFSFSTQPAAGAPAASTTSFGFGQSAAPATTQPTTSFGGGFGQSAAAPATTQPTTSFGGGFGQSAAPTTTQPTSSFGFGAATGQPASNMSFGQPAATTQPGATGSFAVQPTTTSYNVPQNAAAAAAPIALDTPYAKLPAAAKEEIDAVFDKFKRPSREYLADISAQSDGFMGSLSERLKETNLLLLRNENKQALVRNDLSNLRDDAMQVCLETRKSGHSCLEEVRMYGSGRLRKSDHAAKFQANDFFLAAFARLARRLEMFAEEAARIERQLVSMQSLASRKRESAQDVGMYGESPKIGLHELVQLIKSQHAAFLAVTARIAECHRDADHLRTAFKKCFPNHANVFKDEDRREDADSRITSLRVKEQFREHLLLESRGAQGAAAPGSAAGASTAQAGSNAFYAPVSSTTAGGTAAAAAPTSGFGAAPAATNAFGSTAAPAAPGATLGWGASATPAAAPATGGLGSFGAPAAGAGANLFGSSQPQASASPGDLAGVNMNRSFSTNFGSIGGGSSTTGANNKSKSKNRSRGY